MWQMNQLDRVELKRQLSMADNYDLTLNGLNIFNHYDGIDDPSDVHVIPLSNNFTIHKILKRSQVCRHQINWRWFNNSRALMWILYLVNGVLPLSAFWLHLVQYFFDQSKYLEDPL